MSHRFVKFSQYTCVEWTCLMLSAQYHLTRISKPKMKLLIYGLGQAWKKSQELEHWPNCTSQAKTFHSVWLSWVAAPHPKLPNWSRCFFVCLYIYKDGSGKGLAGFKTWLNSNKTRLGKFTCVWHRFWLKFYNWYNLNIFRF